MLTFIVIQKSRSEKRDCDLPFISLNSTKFLYPIKRFLTILSFKRDVIHPQS